MDKTVTTTGYCDGCGKPRDLSVHSWGRKYRWLCERCAEKEGGKDG